MSERKYRRIGYAVFATVLLLLIWLVGMFLFHEQRTAGTLVIQLPRTGTLNIDDTLTVRGSGYGTIRAIDVTEDAKALLTVDLFRPLKVYEGYQVYVEDQGIFGKRTVTLINGPSTAQRLSPEDTLTGEYYEGMMDILGNIYQFMEAYLRFRNTVETLYDYFTEDDVLTPRFLSAITRFDTLLSEIDHFLYEVSIAAEKMLPHGTEQSNLLQQQMSSISRHAAHQLPRTTQVADDLINLSQIVSQSIDEELLENLSSFHMALDDLDSILSAEDMSVMLTQLQDDLETIQKDATRLRVRLRFRDRSSKKEE
ncbi:hypothetical protein [Chitinivibrio alkaliphilus]|uniref:Mce/MlaD domain-containing protein n=1 Tax=Chitinivibrio alkaliphilus ACht1 TaxID=1313304 RepID=U7D8M7_9BACT|nr:hypothetical protein [Chitinivibrio alkaliphilus]ERP39275.1 hypothetical protein CALK_0067 [Chitinivibrio alkaliphilus ACht1]